jgi:DNA repair protein RecO (recombination protein O)
VVCFVVNQLLIAKGKTLDKLTQAETIESYPKLGQELKKLTASQYLAELCLFQALSEQPQVELFTLLNQQLKHLERSPTHLILPYLTCAIFQLLTLEGIAPQVYQCCVTQAPLFPDLETPNWQAGFSASAGGVVTLAALQQLQQRKSKPGSQTTSTFTAQENRSNYKSQSFKRVQLQRSLSARELVLLQALAQFDGACESLEQTFAATIHPAITVDDWLAIEWLLRQYAQYHFDRPIRSAALIDACFDSPSVGSMSTPSERF